MSKSKELSKKNNSLRYFRVLGKWYEMTGIELKTGKRHVKPNFKGKDYLTEREYKEIIKEFSNENKHLTTE